MRWTRLAGLAATLAGTLAAGGVAAQSGDPVRGRQLFLRQCLPCHTVDAGGSTRVGPNLHGMFGRAAATGGRYRFSVSLLNSDIVWDEASVAAYIGAPARTVPGTSMASPEIKSLTDIADLVAYLKDATK